MRIVEVIITIESKDTNYPVKLVRGENKLWSVVQYNGDIRGLYPYEVRIANIIQDKLISGFNATAGD